MRKADVFHGTEAASGIALSDKPGFQWRKKMDETSGRASPRGVIRKKGASESNNIAEVDKSLHWSDRVGKKFRRRKKRERKMSSSLASQGKDNKKVSILASPWKARSYVEETYGFQKFQ